MDLERVEKTERVIDMRCKSCCEPTNSKDRHLIVRIAPDGIGHHAGYLCNDCMVWVEEHMPETGG